MDDEFGTWDCSWYWDNSYADLMPVGLMGASQSSVQLNGALLADSAFCELESDSITVKNVTRLDQFRVLHTAAEGRTSHRHSLENLPNMSPHHNEHCQSNTSINSQSVLESYGSDGYADSLSIEGFEMSDTESQCRSMQSNISSSSVELSSSCSLSDTPITFLLRDGACKNEQSTDDIVLSDDGNHRNMDVASSSESSARNDSQLQQHQPLVFFLIGLFVGLCLGFFTCIITMSAAVHRMHLEIINGQTLYSECQHKRELVHRYVSSEISQVDINAVVGLIWREKFEEMIVENAVLQVKLSSLERRMSYSLDNVQNNVVELNTELTRLKCCVDGNADSLADTVHSTFTSNNSSSTDVIS